MRVASLVPSATETLFALGIGDSVVAVTHECDHPQAATLLPRLTASVIPEGLAPAEIDAQVLEVTGRGESLYTLDEEILAELRPDLIVTQALCAVCAVSFDDVRAVAAAIPSRPEVISLDPTTLAEVFDDVERVAAAAGVPERGPGVVAGLRKRVADVSAAVAGTARTSVLALEWLDPPYIGGHWVPEMIEAAGGRDVIGETGTRSRAASWEELGAADAEIAVVMPCGLYAEEAAAQAKDRLGELSGLGISRAVAVDAASSFSRPGPRLADGVELLGHLLHPDLIEAPSSLAWKDLNLSRTPPASSHAAFGAKAPHPDT